MSDEQEITAPLDTEDLANAWAARAGARPSLVAKLRFAAKTDLGLVRENNEDKFEFFIPDDPVVLATKGRVYALADGMGGHSAGQIAAELALNVFIRSYYADGDDRIELSLKRAISEANNYVVEMAKSVPGRNGMGATLIAAIIRENLSYVAWVGDSRGYLLRNGALELVTEDHSWVAEQVRAGTMTEEAAEASPFRNVITRSIGGAPTAEPDIVALELTPGDRLLLCSDGLSGMLSSSQIQELLGFGAPSVAAWRLVDEANQHGGRDNITVFVLEVEALVPWQEPPATERAAASNGSDPGHAEPEVALPPPVGAASHSLPQRKGLMGRLFGKAQDA